MVDLKFDKFLYGAHIVALEDISINCIKTTSMRVRSEISSEHVLKVKIGTDSKQHPACLYLVSVHKMAPPPTEVANI